MSEPLKKYSLVYDDEGVSGIEKDADGDWYLAADVDAALALRDAEIGRLTGELLWALPLVESIHHPYHHATVACERTCALCADYYKSKRLQQALTPKPEVPR